jgi:hypothetical protein
VSPAPNSVISASSDKEVHVSPYPTSSQPKSSKKIELPNPFPIPLFRASTETNLLNEVLTDGDRKYMVQTLTVMLMSMVQRPSLRHCLIVSQAVHKKYPFLGDETSENAWKWFLYTRAQNVNRKDEINSVAPVSKKTKHSDMAKHSYPIIPPSADDHVSNQRNIQLLLDETLKPKPRLEVLKELLVRTYPYRREKTLAGPIVSVGEMIKEIPALKKSSCMTIEFELIVQRKGVREEFDEELLLWTTAILNYCKNTQTKSTPIKKILSKIEDFECEYNCINFS